MAELQQTRGYQFWRSIGCPQTVVAPMVDHSELPFRMLCRQYGAELVYTQMLHARLFFTDSQYRKANFSTCDGDRPLIAQFCGDDPQTILAAAKLIEHQVDAIDLNLGCPQGIAKKGHYGSFLLSETQLLYDIVHLLSTELSVPVTCKVRKLPTWEETIQMCETLVRAGCSVLTIHGRTKEEKGSRCGTCDWETIARIKQHFHGVLPIIMNGGVENFEDVQQALHVTGADAVMVSEAVLENPALFVDNIDPITQQLKTQLDLAEEYLGFVRQHCPRNFNVVRSHMFKFLYRYGEVFPETREMIATGKTEDQLQEVVNYIREKAENEERFLNCKWYRRYRKCEECVAIMRNPAIRTRRVNPGIEPLDDGFLGSMFAEPIVDETKSTAEAVVVN